MRLIHASVLVGPIVWAVVTGRLSLYQAGAAVVMLFALGAVIALVVYLFEDNN